MKNNLNVGQKRDISLSNFLSMVGISPCHGMEREIAGADLAHREFMWGSRDRVIIDVIKAIESGDLSRAGERDRWDVGWQENLNAYKELLDINFLTPRYLLREWQPVRIHGDYAVGDTNPLIELTFYRLYRKLVFLHYLNSDEIETVYEFGSGSGHNLVALAEIFPDKRIVGLDWSQPAVDIANELQTVYSNISGRRFNFFDPDDTLDIDDRTAILTIGALEQTGVGYPIFMDWLIARNPRLCIHIEPQPDWYDPDTLLGYLGVRFLQVRNYWSGFPLYMYKKTREDCSSERDTEVNVLEHRPVPFGSLFVEGYNRFIWRSGKYRGEPYPWDCVSVG